MSHLLFDHLTGETFDNQTSFTVQSIFDNNSYSTDSITFDDDDVFQCGRCKKQFTTLSIFMQHKKENACNSGPLQTSIDLQNETVQKLPNEIIPLRQEELNTPIILNDADILSLSAYESQEGELSHLEGALTSTNNVLPPHSLETSINISQLPNTNPEIIFTTPDLPVYFDSNNKKLKTNAVNLNECQVILQNGDIMNTDSIEYIEQKKMIIKDINKEYQVIVKDIVNDNVEECLDSVDSNNTFQLLQINPSENISPNENLIDNQNNLVTQIEIINADDPNITSILNPINFNFKQNLINCGNPAENISKISAVKKPKKTKEAKFSCSFCNKEFSKNFDLNQHIRSHTGEKPFQCMICGRAFAQKSNARKHLNTHKVWPHPVTETLPKEVNTPEIENQNPEASLNQSNGYNINNKQSLPQELYACQYCPKQFSQYFDLKKHLKEHEDIKVFQCVQKNCSELFPDLPSLLEHGLLHSADMLYRCFDCGQEFTSLDELGVHQYTHMQPKKRNKRLPKNYVCTKCKSKFVSPEALERHISKSTHDYRCAKCGRVFLCERFLRRHLLSHTTHYAFSCIECHKNFRTEKSLKLHMKLHRGEKEFHCKKCDASFFRNDHLARHALIHENVKRFKCPYKIALGCNREFNRKDKLKYHIRSHINPCSQCNRTFSKQVLLRNHESLVHNGKKCICCGQIFQGIHRCTVQNPMRKRVVPNRRNKNNKNAKANTNDPETSKASNNDTHKTEELDYLNAENMNVIDQVSQDDVPTIEIIVMPMPSRDEIINQNPYPTILQPSENNF